MQHCPLTGKVLLQLWFLRTVSYTQRALQRCLGSIQWLCTPNSVHAPLLARAYSFLHSVSHAKLIHRNLFRSLLYAVLFSTAGWKGRKLPPPMGMPLIFLDAAPQPHGFAVAALVACAPTWVISLQSAELYGVFRALRFMQTRKISHACLVTDNAAVFHTMLSGRVRAQPCDRLRISRRTTRLFLDENLHLQMALNPSKQNLADPYTRNAAPNTHTLPPLAHHRSFTSSLLRFWWYSSVEG